MEEVTFELELRETSICSAKVKVIEIQKSAYCGLGLIHT